MINRYKNIEKLGKILNNLKNSIDRIVQITESDIYWLSMKEQFTKAADVLEKEEHPLYSLVKELSEKEAIGVYNKRMISLSTIKPLVDKIKPILDSEVVYLQPYLYKNLVVDYQYYKVKTVLYSEGDYGKDIKYVIASFQSRQELNAFLANMQKGLKRNYLEENRHMDLCSIKNGYECLFDRCQDENVGDGIHAVIWHNDERVLRVHNGSNPVNRVFEWLKANTKTGLIEEWKDYFYNELNNLGLIQECEGFDLTGKAPKILVLSQEIDTELVRTIKQQGLKCKEITLPVEENVKLDPQMSFLELIQEFVLPHIQNEKAHYNIGDPIDPIIKSSINVANGKTTRLFPRQQVIAQGIVNAIKEGKYSQFLNGGTGIGSATCCNLKRIA